MQTELVQALRPVVAFLDHCRARYFVGGSVASSYHGASRSTLDVDLTAQLNESAVTDLCAALSDNYYLNEQSIRSAIRRNSCFNLIHFETSFKVDVFVSDASPYSDESQKRAIIAELDVDPILLVRMASVEDIIIIKLDWYRLGGEASERQWSDLRTVAMLNVKQLDFEYVGKWAQLKGLTSLFERLLKEIHFTS